ncbi:MAG: hypothetical protein FWH19_05310 [Treponema sp.]|nr:hypothetical protein [Treponema sp.]
MKKTLLICSLLIAHCYLAFALDFGLVLNQNAELAAYGSEADFVYRGTGIPRLSGLLGDSGGFYISVGLNYDSDPWNFVPELLRTDLYMRSGGFDFRMGRMSYADPLGFIAEGLFDGLRFSHSSAAGTFSAGAWYTGLLYKQRANIAMTEKELDHYNADLDYNDFFNSYFAPRRLLAALDWENQGIGGRVMARVSALGQFDIFDHDLHSQYLTGKLLIPVGVFAFDLGGCYQLLEVFERNEYNIYTAFAAEFGIITRTSNQRLSLSGRYFSADTDYSVDFLPLTTVSQGSIISPSLPGLSVISLDYTARLHRTFALAFTPNYFFYIAPERNERMLGGEVFGAFYWSPVSDISINLGGGAFFHSLGDISPNANALWKVEMNIVISLF